MSKTSLRQHAHFDLRTPFLWGLFAFYIIVFSPLIVGKALAIAPVQTQLKSGSLPVLRHMEAVLDESGRMDIRQIQGESVQMRFVPFDPKKFTDKQGVLWLKLAVAPQYTDAANPAHALLLDLGQGAGSHPKLYALENNPSSGEIHWAEHEPSKGSVFLLPIMDDATNIIYVRLEGVPGIWFAPYLRTPHNMATAYELFAKPAAIVALIVVMLLCLLRGFTERGQWRYWAALYTAVNLYYAVYGLPVVGLGHIPMAEMLKTMAPGVALILFAHVGRHILKHAQNMRSFTLQFILLTLVGIGIAILPLLPGFVWTVRYLDLWPILMLLFVPTALGAWISGIGGAKRYFAACILPPLSLAVALLGLYEPAHFDSMAIIPTSMLFALPLCGLALGALVLAGTTSVKQVPLDEEKSGYVSAEETVEDLLEQDPNLRLVPAGEAQSEAEADSEVSNDGDSVKKAILDLEEQLRWSMEQLLREVVALESCALPKDARENAVAIVATTREICGTINSFAKERRPIQSLGGTEAHVFDLQSILRQAHDTVSPAADKKNIALSWFMQPDLASCYKGDALQLLFVLRLLLESAVRSTHRGAIHLNVRRVPESVNQGHLLFTITDSGTGKPPYDRSVTALARAWELSASYHGFLGVECNALGASISFTVHYEVCARREQQPEAERKPLPVLLVSDNVEERHMWGFFLEKMSAVIEARNGEEALEMFEMYSASLIIFDARMPLGHVYSAMNGFEQISAARNEEFPICMAIYMDAELEKSLLDMGFSYLFAMPVTRQQLCEAVEDIFLRHGDGAQVVSEGELRQEDDEMDTPAEDVYSAHESYEREDTEEENENIQSDETNNAHEENGADEIIDTGMPILEMAQANVKETRPLPASNMGLPDINIDSPPVQENSAQEQQHVEQYSEQFGKKQRNIVLIDPSTLQQNISTQDRSGMAESAEEVEGSSKITEMSGGMKDRQGSLSDAIFMPFGSVEQDSSQKGQAEDGAAFSEENTFFSHYAQTINSDVEKGSRPSPAQDKSNAAYLTSLVDMENSVQSDTLTEEVEEKRVVGPKIKQTKAARLSSKKATASTQEITQKNVDEVIHEPKASTDKPKMRISGGKPVLKKKNVQRKQEEDVVAVPNSGQADVKGQRLIDVEENNTMHSIEHSFEQEVAGVAQQAVVEEVLENTVSDKKAKSPLKIKSVKTQKLSTEKLPSQVEEVSEVKKIADAITIGAAVNTSVADKATAVSAVTADTEVVETMNVDETVKTGDATERSGDSKEKGLAAKIVKILKPKKKEAAQATQTSEALDIQTDEADKNLEARAHEFQEWVGEPTPINQNGIEPQVNEVVSKSEEGGEEPVVSAPKAEQKIEQPVDETKKIKNKITRLLMPKKAEKEKPLTLTDKYDVEFVTHTHAESLEFARASQMSSLTPAAKAKQETVSIKPSITAKDKKISQEAPVSVIPRAHKKISIGNKSLQKQEQENLGGGLPELSMPKAANVSENISSPQRIIDDAELRGREELRHLRSYLDSSSALQSKPFKQEARNPMEKYETPQQSAFQPIKMSTVGEPSPMLKDNSLNLVNSNAKFGGQTQMTKNHTPSPIEQLLLDLDTWISDANACFHAGDAAGVEEAAHNMAQSADGFGLRTLARLARTVESAAKARDLVALGDLLPELDNNVQRNRAALKS